MRRSDDRVRVMARAEIQTENAAAEKPAELAKLPSAGRRNGRWAAYWALLGARIKELQREPEVVFWVFGFPLLLALGLGIAFREKPADVTRVVVVAGPEARRVVEMIQNADKSVRGTDLLAGGPQTSRPGAGATAPRSLGGTHIQADVLEEAQALDQFRLGKYALVIMPPREGTVGYRYDPARPESVLAKAEVNDALQDAAGRHDPIATETVAATEPGARYIDFLIPGLLGMNLMNSGMWGVGFALVEMRQRKLLKRFVATPMRKTDFLMALTSSRLVLMIVEVALLLGFGMLAFHMRVVGSLLAILLLGSIGAISFAGIGLLTASRAQKIESVSGLINLVMMPMWIFSGVFFSYERFPAIIQPLIKALPLTALNDALRATILQGEPLLAQGGRLAVMAVWGGISFVLALRWFRWA